MAVLPRGMKNLTLALKMANNSNALDATPETSEWTMYEVVSNYIVRIIMFTGEVNLPVCTGNVKGITCLESITHVLPSQS